MHFFLGYGPSVLLFCCIVIVRVLSLCLYLSVSEFVRPCKLSSGALLVCLSVCISVCVCVCPGVVRSCNLSPGALVVPVIAIISLGPRASPAVIATSSDSRRQKQRSLTQPTWRTAALWEWCYRYVICLSVCLSQNRVGTVLLYESGATGMSSVCLSVCHTTLGAVLSYESGATGMSFVSPCVCHKTE